MELQMYIKGKWYAPEDRSHTKVINPANGQIIGKAINGTVKDTQYAIQVARETFDQSKWRAMTNEDRSHLLWEIADKIDEHHEELTQMEMLDNGKPLREAQVDIDDAAACFRYYASIIRNEIGKTYQTTEDINTMVIREPIGVCGLIVPWNFPLLMGVYKIAAALAAGNTIVFKPSEVTPMTAVKLFEILDEVKLPAGVANLVLGEGNIVGQEIAENHDIDMVSFTGGTETGRKIMQAATGNLKKVSLELGGKSPNIFFADIDLDTAVDHALYGIYYGAGQVCSAGSRILVEESMFDLFIKRFAERAEKIRVGPGHDPQTEMGPLVSVEHLEKVLHYIEIGKQEGAKLLCGGYRLTEDGLDQGYFVAPTAFINVNQEMRIVQEEVFGPLVTIQSFTDEAEAIMLANDTKYGLAGGVYTSDQARAMRLIKQVRAGITWINTYHDAFYEAPWGGYKESGIGRSLSEHGLLEFSEVKQINTHAQLTKVNWFTE